VTIADLVADRRALTPSEAAVCATPDRAELLGDLGARALRMHQLVQARLIAGKERLLDLARRRVLSRPLERLHERERSLDEWGERLHRAMQKRVQLAESGIERIAAHLESLSPLNILSRGYSLTRTLPERHVVRTIEQVQVGDAVEITLRDGRLTARVEGQGSP